jgi:hypothetical protein
MRAITPASTSSRTARRRSPPSERQGEKTAGEVARLQCGHREACGASCHLAGCPSAARGDG